MVNDKDNLFICGEHQIPVMYRGDHCPWCDFINSMKEQIELEYKRGYQDGIDFAETRQAMKEKEK
jgi:hypothetical protein